MTEPAADGLIAEHVLRGLRLATALIALAVLTGLAWPNQIAAGRPGSLLALGVLTIIAGIAVGLAVRRRPWGRYRYPLALATLVVAVTDTASLPGPLIATYAHQTLGSAGWIWVALFLDYAFAPAVCFIAAHHASVVVAMLAAASERQTLLAFLLASTSIITFQLTAASAAVALRRVARRAAASATRRSELAGQEDVARQLHADRIQRYTELRTSALPLLQAIAEGQAKPSEPSVQLRAAHEAARMRRLFAEADDTSDPLVGGLAAAASVAEHRGLVVNLTSIGQASMLPAAARRRLIDEVAQVLLQAVGQARVTVVAEPAVTSIDVVTRTDTPVKQQWVPHEGITVSHLVEGSTLWMQARWTAAQR